MKHPPFDYPPEGFEETGGKDTPQAPADRLLREREVLDLLAARGDDHGRVARELRTDRETSDALLSRADECDQIRVAIAALPSPTPEPMTADAVGLEAALDAFEKAVGCPRCGGVGIVEVDSETEGVPGWD